MKKIISITIALVTLFNLSSCGLFLYPERQNQRNGRLDTPIVLLDGVLLLFFIVPGVIAYAVDFASGTIYLPKEACHCPADKVSLDGMVAIKVGKDNLTKAKIASVISEYNGKNISGYDSKVYMVDANGKKSLVN